MKYGLFNETQSPADIESYVDGAHIIVMRDVNNFIESTIELEDLGWEVRDSIKVLFDDKSLQATLLRKPFKGTIVNNFLSNGCGGINIDACRIASNGEHKNWKPSVFSNRNGSEVSVSHIAGSKNRDAVENDNVMRNAQLESIGKLNSVGRYPANLILQKGIALQQGSDSARYFFQFDSRQELETYLTTMIRID